MNTIQKNHNSSLDGKSPVRKILVFGATGLVGREVVRLLCRLAEEAPAHIIAVCRRSVPLTYWCESPHLQMALFSEPAGPDGRAAEAAKDQWILALQTLDWQGADEVYCCIGTTIKKAGSRKQFWSVDVHFAEAIATLAEKNGVRKLSAISAQGASARSAYFYMRAKAAMEQAFAVSGLPMVHLVRPGLLLGNREEHRPGEAFAAKLFGRLGWLFKGYLKKFKPVTARQVARAMIGLMNTWPDVPVPDGYDPKPGGVFFHESISLDQW